MIPGRVWDGMGPEWVRNKSGMGPKLSGMGSGMGPRAMVPGWVHEGPARSL